MFMLPLNGNWEYLDKKRLFNQIGRGINLHVFLSGIGYVFYNLIMDFETAAIPDLGTFDGLWSPSRTRRIIEVALGEL